MSYSLTATGDISGTWPTGSFLTGSVDVSFLGSDPFGVIVWHWGRVGVDSGQWATTSTGVDPSSESSPKTMPTGVTFTDPGIYDVWVEVVHTDFVTQYVELDLGTVTISGAPAITSVRYGPYTTSYQVVGREVDLVGVNFSSVTSVLVGTAPAVFTIVDSTHITLIVPSSPSAASGGITVINPDGSDNWATFHALWPGDWITPPTATNEIPLFYREYHVAPVTGDTPSLQTSGTGPPTYPGAALTSTTSSGGVLAWFNVGHLSYDPSYAWDGFFGLAGFDLDVMTADRFWTDRYMPFFDASGEVDPAGAFWYETEIDIPGHPEGDYNYTDSDLTRGGSYVDSEGVDVTLHLTPNGGYWVDDQNDKVPDLTVDIWSTTVQWIRASSSLYESPDSFTIELVDPTTWPSGAGTVLLASLMVDDVSQLTEITNGGTFPGSNNYIYNTDVVPPSSVAIHLTDADMDTGRRFAAMVMLDRQTGLITSWSPPYLNPANASHWDPMSNGVMWKQLSADATATFLFTYQPPRYRLLFTHPPRTRGWTVGSISMSE